MAEVQPTSHDTVIDSTPWGLRLIGDESRQGGTTVDIIAVHGLGANPDHAWVRHKDISAGRERDVRWLTDLLPQTFREYRTSISARIFCFNYQSAWLGPQLSRSRLESISVRLLDEILNERDKDRKSSNRPLIFIGHSFGGLVIEQAVVRANTAGGRYEYLVKLIGGIVLLGTPHQGSKSQKWGSILVNLAGLVDYGESGLMKEVDEKSMKIFDLVSEFKRIMISMDLAKTAVICFYENCPTNYLPRVLNTGQWIQKHTSSIVVEETSAVLSGFHSVVLDSDHLKLNKFPSAQDGNYVSVSSNLCRIAAEAPELIQRRRKEPASNRNSHFLVPRKRVKNFIGRESLLEDIRSHFSSHQTGSPLNLIIYALGGQGKSQIALEYCRKWRDTYRGVFWINANSETTVTQSYSTFAAELVGGSQIESSDSTVKIKLVKDHLEKWRESWLLVFDNYDEPEKFPEVDQFIPTRGYGHVLFTSRNRELGRLGTLLEITPVSTEEGVRLLLRGYNINDVQEQHRDAASEIVERLGHLALAIDQAAAYIKHKRMPLDRLRNFLTTYEAERQKILSYTPKNFWEYEHINAFTTWELSFQQLGSGDEWWIKATGHFLTLSAFFAPITITESLFLLYHERCHIDWIRIFIKDGGLQDDEDSDESKSKEDDQADDQSSGRNSDDIWDPDRFWDVIARSDELSLVQSISPGTGPEGACFSLHPLIRDWLQLRLKSKMRADYTQEAIQVLECCAMAYENLSTTLGEKTALLTHMDVSLSNEKEFLKPQDRLGYQLENCNTAAWFAEFYKNAGQYRTSEKLYRRTLETLRSGLGEKHPDTLFHMSNLADVLLNSGNLKEAEQMHHQTLTLRETEIGEEHPDTLSSMNNLAQVLRFLGRYKEAESMHRQVLTLRERVLGGEHPDTLTSINNFSSTLIYQNRYEEAERICRETLTLREKVLGREHPGTLTSMNNLALVLSHQEKYKEAERIHRETLTLIEKVLGREHPNTLNSMNNLGSTLTDQNKYEEAERIFRETVTLREKVSGREHPGTLTSMNNLGSTLTDQNKYEEAERIFRETVTLREIILGREHPDTLTSIHNLADTLVRQNRYEEAELIFREKLILSELVLGKEHPDTLSTKESLARVLYIQGQREEAERLYRELLMLREMVQGKEHPDTLLSRENLSIVLGNQHRYEEAEPIQRETLTLREIVLGQEHPDTVKSRGYLARILSAQGKHEEAERLYREVLMLKEMVQGKEHPDTVESRGYLARILSAQGKHEEAERLYREVLMLKEMVQGKEHPDTLLSRENLSIVLGNQHRYEEAEPIQRETLTLREIFLGQEHPDTVESRAYLAWILSAQGKHEEAELIAAVGATKQSETSSAASLTGDPASFDQGDVALSSSVGP